KDHLVAALVDWRDLAAVRGIRGTEQAKQARRRKAALLLSLAMEGNNDPWHLRALVAWRDRGPRGLETLVRGEALGKRPRGDLLWLARVLAATKDFSLAVEVLRRAQRRFPDDFWVNHCLGHYLTELRPPRRAEAIGFYRVAVALRPRSP